MTLFIFSKKKHCSYFHNINICSYYLFCYVICRLKRLGIECLRKVFLHRRIDNMELESYTKFFSTLGDLFCWEEVVMCHGYVKIAQWVWYYLCKELSYEINKILGYFAIYSTLANPMQFVRKQLIVWRWKHGVMTLTALHPCL